MLTARFKTALASPLPPPLRRAIHGYLGRRVVFVDELPPERRPAALSLTEIANGLERLGAELTVLSYNVKRAERLRAVAATIERAVEDHRPDLIFLQETPVELFRHPQLAKIFAPRSLFFAPFHQIDRPDRRYPYDRYGQLIASARLMREPRVIELPTVNPATLGPGHIMKRIALYAELPTADGRTVGAVNVHNEPFARRRDRCLQYEAFLRAIDRRAPDVAVCSGDFNPSLSQRGEPGLRLLEAHGFDNAFAHRWRTLDTCLARGHAGFLSADVLPLVGSDHRPIFIRLRL